MADANVDQYTFHTEPCEDIPLVCRKIKEAGMKVGIAIKPGTPVSCIEEYIDLADMILVMTVEPGFGGQKFMTNMMSKVEWLRANYPSLDIEVDGGVGPSTIDICAKVKYINCTIWFNKKNIIIKMFIYKNYLNILNPSLSRYVFNYLLL